MKIYRILSALLSYPQPDLIAAVPEIEEALAEGEGGQLRLAMLEPLLTYLQAESLITLQENYVATFDRTPSQALHLFEHIHGESRDRGQAMVDLIEEYRAHGFEPEVNELPDFVPLFLEFLSLTSTDDANRLLGDAIHVLAAIGVRLQRNDSPYSVIFEMLTTLTDVVPREQDDPPVRDMDEAMETFGPGADGVEPLLRPQTAASQVVNFYPRQAKSAMHPASVQQKVS